MLTAGELAAARAVQAQTLTETATIYRRTLASDGMGGQTESTAQSTAACRVAPARPAETALVAGQVRELQAYRITFPAETDVRTDDKVAVRGVTYEVLGVLAPATLETARVVLAVQR